MNTSTYESVIRELLRTNQQLTAQLIEMSKVLAETNKPVVEPVQWPAFSNEPLYEPEEVEDAKHAFKMGLINKEQLEEELRKAGFQNTAIELG